MKRNLLSLALVLVMALSLMTVTAFATDDDVLEQGDPPATDVVLDQENDAAPPVVVDQEEPQEDPPAECTGAADCPAEAHNPGCLALILSRCTGDENCPNPKNDVNAHKPGCLLITKSEEEPETPQEPVNNAQPVIRKAPANNVPEDPEEEIVPNAILQHKHTLVKHEEEAATCGKEGKRQYWSCTDCDILLTREDADATAGVSEADLVLKKLTNHNWSKNDGYCTVCNEKCEHTGDTNKNDATCSICGAVNATRNDCGHYVVREEITNRPANCGQVGYEITGGGSAWYCPLCPNGGRYYNSPTGSTAVTVKVTAATGEHTKDGSFIKTSSAGHTYKCKDCGNEFLEGHTFGDDNICDICNYDRTSSPSPSPSNYISISSAHLNSYSISLTWTSDLPDGTVFDIYVDSDVHRTVSLYRTSGGYFSYTVEYGSYLGDPYYDVSVRAGSVYSGTTRLRNGDYDWDHDYWYDHYYPDGYYPNSTPSTNSYGIPYASQVNGRYSASEAIRILRGKNQYNLQNDLMSSSSALDSFERLERAVKDANNVYVTVSTDRSGVPSALRTGSGVQITGAAFNASSTNSTVRLTVDRPSVNRYAGRGYQFSMSLSGVGGDASLDVPVVVSMPLPSDISANYVKVLHYHNSNVPTVITPKVSGGRISFPLTGFSDFVITDDGVPNYTYIADGYGGYYVPVPSAPRRSLVDEHLSVILPLVASTPVSGYVYDDVSGTYWAATQIAWARDGGLMTGYYDGTFRPWAGTTRQELWMVLARLSGANPADMAAARQWAMNVGITDGTNPYSPLSKQQMISMLYRYASYRRMDLTAPSNLSYYRDGASVSAYARTAMNWATNKAIITGDSNGYLHPQDVATRADFAVYLYRFLQ